MPYRIRNQDGRYLGKRGSLATNGPRPWVDDPDQAVTTPTKGEARDLLDTLPAGVGARIEQARTNQAEDEP